MVCTAPQTTRIALPRYTKSGLAQNYDMNGQWFKDWFICCNIATCYLLFIKLETELHVSKANLYVDVKQILSYNDIILMINDSKMLQKVVSMKLLIYL